MIKNKNKMNTGLLSKKSLFFRDINNLTYLSLMFRKNHFDPVKKVFGGLCSTVYESILVLIYI